MKYPRPHLGDALTRRRALTILGLTVPAVAAACTTVGSNQPEEAPSPGASLTFLPDDKAKDVNPTAPVSVTVTNGWFRDVKLVNADGKVVAGALSRDQTRFHTTEPLGFDVKYTWKGSAVGLDGKAVPVSGAFTTLVPTAKVNGQFQLADGQTVGIAAPVIIQFDAHIADKAAVERSLSISCDPPTEGGWAWLPDEAQGSRVHWRSREYFKAGTKVEVKANLYGIPFGDGAFGNEDMSLDFSVGRRQVVYADAQSHRIRVTTDEGTILDLPCSYGEGDLPRNVTRSGIHVVTEKYEDFWMSNPAAGYSNVHERFAVRISNNGEFIHANPNTIGQQGNTNVTNGCINLSLGDAESYFRTAIYGDPVEVTGTSIELSYADGDLWDWVVDWPTWQSMSALPPNPGERTVTSSPATSSIPTTVPLTPSGAPTLSGTPTSTPSTTSGAPSLSATPTTTRR
ncbi:L,D-transpeptidase [Mycobacteroides abscessus subsp. abscessus]|uniref:L,D-transpeptidase n=1 Tax=Mycobacteroides abscessus TaxID=36809 RepID=UPI00092A9FF3|nr:Ig-like domain-containing protein [Mycobacteroides abscessus]SIL39131.1 L,D-transpeptidase [Mycobacteroides abscessus subsp. abscessus]SLD60283.1 L,D-transpeptidase [Mycobacteroides abscessus subsp. abscessus]